jgi:hypothetical protein
MNLSVLVNRPIALSALLLFAGAAFQGCMMEWGAELQWNSRSQILMSESSQVKLRSVQSRVFETTDRNRIIKAAIAAMQDLFFRIDVLDEDLGLISGKKMYNSGSSWADHPTYYGYKTDELILFSTVFRTWGPFEFRRDLTRMTVTVRPKEKTRSLVRASVQYNLRAVEDPEMYQKFFKTLEQSMFLSSQMK